MYYNLLGSFIVNLISPTATQQLFLCQSPRFCINFVQAYPRLQHSRLPISVPDDQHFFQSLDTTLPLATEPCLEGGTCFLPTSNVIHEYLSTGQLALLPIFGYNFVITAPYPGHLCPSIGVT